MILSVSRRTDIPCFYSDWFFHRLKEGFVYVRNPMNPHQISRIALSPDIVDCIVFWTKNPAPMMNRLEELNGYPYYFQFTLTGYGKDIEPGIPHKKQVMLPLFQELSRRTSPQQVIWRYDPILFTERYTTDYHIKAFEEIAGALEGYTEQAVISFVDIYRKMQTNMPGIQLLELEPNELVQFASALAEIARKHGIKISSCAEAIDLKACGIEHGSCIDKNFIQRLLGCELLGDKDKNQRGECRCMESVEIGTYDTCRNGCRYCYACRSEAQVQKNSALYDPKSPMLCGNPPSPYSPEMDAGDMDRDRITERNVKTFRKQKG